jgi:sarcosine oxidase
METVASEYLVLGLGVMGAATLYHLAKSGHRVAGLDRFPSPHVRGSSHGRSRALSLFYGSPYLELAMAGRQGWQDLEQESGRRLFYPSGMIVFDRAASPDLRAATTALQAQGVEHHLLAPADVGARFPQLRAPQDTVACYMPLAGFIDADLCVQALLDCAIRHGARVYEPDRVESIDLGEHKPVARSSSRSYRSDTLVVTPGPWAPSLLSDCRFPLQITCQNTFYFQPESPSRYGPDDVPVVGDRLADIYCFPVHGPGIKVASSSIGPATSADEKQHNPGDDELRTLQTWLEQVMPGVGAQPLGGSSCFYSMTPDKDFIIGFHPHHERVVVGAGFSGHGFKFAPAVGRILADLATRGTSDVPLDTFSPLRFR